MRLHTFLDQYQSKIVAEAVSFARTLGVFSEADEVHVRDHIPQMLRAIADDLRTDQTRAASIAKSQGMAAAADVLTNADHHGQQRARSGLSIELLVAEYRALRSSILRLWSEHKAPDAEALNDMSRFNEAVDQAIAESVRAFATETENRRQLFLAALGHDLRGPLNAILLTSRAIAMSAAPPIDGFAAVLSRGAKRMTALLDSLLDYNVVSLGGAVTLRRAEADLQPEFEEEIVILHAAFPGSRIELAASGDCRGEFDASRLREALSNLVSNAAKYGVPGEPIHIALQGDDDNVRVTVVNSVEQPISASELALLFEPLRRRAIHRQAGDRTSLGLGLFITREIATAHGGDATATCAGHTVSFTIAVPKRAAPGENCKPNPEGETNEST